MLPFIALLAAVKTGSAAAALSSYMSPPPVSTIEPSLTQIEKAAATALSLSPVSNVKGAAFDRFYQIWLENTDYSSAASDLNVKKLSAQGITLTNYWAVTHPSEPNYCAVAGGDYFGMDNDNFNRIPANVSTVVDLLDVKGISWAEYQEHEPYPGFQGFNYSNQATYTNDYVRKHNPLILYDSVIQNQTRLELIKNFTGFNNDLKNQRLPQWAFFTPNMTNDGHDTNVTVAVQWSYDFLIPLLNNDYFSKDTLIILTFDENESYAQHNKVFTLLLGGAVPEHLRGTTDDTFYTHYSNIASVSQNWALPSLGRWDCHANVFQLVTDMTGYKTQQFDTKNLYLNQSYPGPMSAKEYVPIWPVPTTDKTCANGMGVLSSVAKTWGGMKPTLYDYSQDCVGNLGGSAG
ncbi:hypothetical protein LTR70_010731 [Exophiala xenobiotica]|uniref:Acid phosphatase n=1 Tax=Lithohypha guttulata TaxID=1690604 RepID=A0ABR0JUK6_9EURO|nr:hypothetical protein LTR24_010714 [Lithohypha guttulata]KAK5308926.1 hypothetical protein LTR70_010731 [Exophiala xenobiotica]